MEPPIQVSITGTHYTGKTHWEELGESLCGTRCTGSVAQANPCLRMLWQLMHQSDTKEMQRKEFLLNGLHGRLV